METYHCNNTRLIVKIKRAALKRLQTILKTLLLDLFACTPCLISIYYHWWSMKTYKCNVDV